MHAGDGVPRVGVETGMKDVIYEMSRKGLGMTTVQDDNGWLLGVITDGDLRRLMERDPDPLVRRADEVMHRGGVTLAEDELASAALKMMEDRRITSLMVSGPDGEVIGVVHLHDLWGIGLF
jgi:arabinose-5-phosphate isomerase